jgi:hypothetical protein
MHESRRVSRSAALPGDEASGARLRPPFECIALLLQGGGALGAYQAGVFEGLAVALLTAGSGRGSRRRTNRVGAMRIPFRRSGLDYVHSKFSRFRDVTGRRESNHVKKS